MAGTVIRFPQGNTTAIAASDQRPETDDTITFTRDSLRPLTTAHPAMPRPSSGFEHRPWTDLVTRNFDGRG